MSGKQSKRNRQVREVRVDRAAQMRQQREAAQQRRSRLLTIGIGALVLVVVAVATFAIARASRDQADVQAGEGPTPSGVTAEGGVLYTQADPGETPPSAEPSVAGEPVPVVVYEDFQCPVCRSF